MLAAVYHNNRDVRVVQMPVPPLGPGELLVRVMASGICGSDVLEWYRLKTAPRVLGHEVSGVVEKVGEGVEKFRVGDRVFVTHHVPCMSCHWCLSGRHTDCRMLHTTNFDPGGFAQFVRVPAVQVERGMLRLPNEVSFEAGSFVEPLACVVRGQRLAGLEAGRSVAVLGAGISGMLHVALASARGAWPVLVVEPQPLRRRWALQFGAQAAIGPEEDPLGKMRDLCGRGADVVVVSAGVMSAFRQALDLLERGGTILAFAVPPPGKNLEFPLCEFWQKGAFLLSTYAGAPEDCRQALGLIATGAVPVTRMITHRLPLGRIQEGFDLVAAGGESLKVIILPQADAGPTEAG